MWARAQNLSLPYVDPSKFEALPTDDECTADMMANQPEPLEDYPSFFDDDYGQEQAYPIHAPKLEPLDVEAAFAEGGPLHKPGFEVRPGQVRLARAIYDALAGGGHLLAEGPCGIGKSKAYGVPAAYLASQGKRVIIVTASIALQDQLVTKDLPELVNDLSAWGEIRVEILKGRSNYLCLWQREEEGPDGLSTTERKEYEAIERWAEKTTDGDRTRLPMLPSPNVWRRFSTTTEECLGKECDHYDKCFAYAAKRRAEDAGVVVTNYHMLMVDLEMGGFVLPAADALVLDEAHEAANIARDFLGFSLTENMFRNIAKECKKRGFSMLGAQIDDAAHKFFSALVDYGQSRYYASYLRVDLPIDSSPLIERLKEFRESLPKSKLVDRSSELATLLHRACFVKSEGADAFVTSIEIELKPGKPPRPKLVSRVIEPGETLRRLLWDRYPSIAAVSATITTDNNFAYVRKEIGAPDEAKELIVESPFDFERMSARAIFERMPEPSSEEYAGVASKVIEHVAKQAKGRTLVLCTSYKSVRAYAEYLRAQGEFHVLAQGEAPVATIVEEFKKAATTRPTVLLGTSSLWTGVDVQGPALSAVVIDRIPFASPDDPVAKRIGEKLGSKAFSTFTVPASILQFRQGAGRLIRSQRDRGVLVLLDPRLLKKGYGGRFLRSLPSAPRIKLGQIASFLEGNES